MILCQKVTIDSALRIRLPKELVDLAGLKVGDPLYVAFDEDCKGFVITTGNSKGLDFVCITKES